MSISWSTIFQNVIHFSIKKKRKSLKFVIIYCWFHKVTIILYPMLCKTFIIGSILMKWYEVNPFKHILGFYDHWFNNYGYLIFATFQNIILFYFQSNIKHTISEYSISYKNICILNEYNRLNTIKVHRILIYKLWMFHDSQLFKMSRF